MNTNQINRREFLTQTMLTTAGTALALGSRAPEAQAAEKTKLSTPNAEKLGWRMCCQIYSFRDRTFYEALDVLSGVGVRLVEPGFFLPLSKERKDLTTSEKLTPAQRKEMKQRMNDLGMSMPNYYGPIEGNKDAFRKIFDFAKEMGVETLVAEPPAEVLETVDNLCAEYKMRLGIHNHPEGPGSKYWDPNAFVKAVEGRSPRIGGCPDTGHWVRTGLNTLDCLKKYENRIVTIHLKDAEVSGKRDSRDVPLGTGKANYPAVLKQLLDWKWRGVMTIEYEHLSPQLVQEFAQCVKFVEDFATNTAKQ